MASRPDPKHYCKCCAQNAQLAPVSPALEAPLSAHVWGRATRRLEARDFSPWGLTAARPWFVSLGCRGLKVRNPGWIWARSARGDFGEDTKSIGPKVHFAGGSIVRDISLLGDYVAQWWSRCRVAGVIARQVPFNFPEEGECCLPGSNAEEARSG